MKLLESISTPAWAVRFRVVVNKCAICDRSLALRHFSSYKAGIRMSGQWYCSSRCFVSGAEELISRLVASGHQRVNRPVRMGLGLSLINRGLVTSTQLREVMDKQKEIGGDIGDLLVRHCSLNEKQVTAVRATQWGCPVFEVPKDAARTAIQIPLILKKLYSAIPLHYVSATKLLLVGFVQNIEYGLLYAIEQMSGCKTQACFVTPTDFRQQIDRQEQFSARFAEMPATEMEMEGFQTPVEIASTVCDYSADLEADEALIVKCREYVWARLKADAKEVDLLFRTA